MLPSYTAISYIYLMSRKYKFGAQKNNNAAKFQLWQPENHPIQLINTKMAHQKLIIYITIL
jgi:hypothetical protein